MRRLLLLLTALLVLAALLVPAAPAAAAWVWPVKGEVITPYRNGSDPYASGQHRGIDIAAAVGTPIVAAAGGEVRFAGIAGSSGLTVSVRTGDGYDTSYLHLSSLAVRAGARVSAGERLGAVGTSGTRSAFAPHLHFGVRDARTQHAYHDPLAFLPAPPAAPGPEPPVPAAAPAPEPAVPSPSPLRRAPAPAARALAPVPAPLATAPAPRRAAGRIGRPAPARPLSGRATAPTPARIRPQRAVATNELSRHSAALSHHPGAAPGSAEARSPAEAGHSPAEPGSREAARMRSPSLAGSSSGTRQTSPPPHAVRAAATTAASPEHDRPDIAWALACGGLLLAAAILGLREDRGRSRPLRKASLGTPVPAAPTRVESE